MSKKISGPTSISIAASAVLALGVYDGILMIFSWLQGKSYLEFNLLFIWWGWGALKGREGCRLLISIVFFIIPVTVFALIALILPLAFFFSDKLSSVDTTFSWGFSIITGAWILWLGLTHFRADESPWFKGEAGDTKILRYAVVSCAIFLGASSGYSNYLVHNHLKQIYYYDVTIVARDADTREILRPNFSWTGGSLSDPVEGVKMPSSLSSVSFDSNSEKGGTMSGIAYSDLKVDVSAEGYLPETVTISKSQRGLMEVFLKKEAADVSVED